MTLSQINDVCLDRLQWGQTVKRVVLSDAQFELLLGNIAPLLRYKNCCTCGKPKPTEGSFTIAMVCGAVEIVKASSITAEYIVTHPKDTSGPSAT